MVKLFSLRNVVFVNCFSILIKLPTISRLIYSDTVCTQKLLMRDLTVVNPDWLLELAPHFYHKTVEK